MSEWVLRGQPDSVPLARRLATQDLADAATEDVDTVALLVSELVTNCVRHAQADFHLRVTQNEQEVRIEVSDTSAKEPQVRHPDVSESHGRGLQIVQLLSRAWGVEPATEGSGKTVWCTIALTGALADRVATF